MRNCESGEVPCLVLDFVWATGSYIFILSVLDSNTQSMSLPMGSLCAMPIGMGLTLSLAQGGLRV